MRLFGFLRGESVCGKEIRFRRISLTHGPPMFVLLLLDTSANTKERTL